MPGRDDHPGLIREGQRICALPDTWRTDPVAFNYFNAPGVAAGVGLKLLSQYRGSNYQAQAASALENLPGSGTAENSYHWNVGDNLHFTVKTDEAMKPGTFRFEPPELSLPDDLPEHPADGYTRKPYAPSPETPGKPLRRGKKLKHEWLMVAHKALRDEGWVQIASDRWVGPRQFGEPHSTNHAVRAVLKFYGWREGNDGLWRTDRFGGSFNAANALNARIRATAERPGTMKDKDWISAGKRRPTLKDKGWVPPSQR